MPILLRLAHHCVSVVHLDNVASFSNPDFNHYATTEITMLEMQPPPTPHPASSWVWACLGQFILIGW